MSDTSSVLLLGIGNVLWADEGFGVRVVEHLRRHYRFPESVTVMDGGTQGVYLVEHVQAAEVLVIFDAIDYGLAPGTLHCLYDDEVPAFLGAKKMSLHQTGFQEVLIMARMLGQYPKQLLLIGVQPYELDDYGGSLRAEVKAQLQPAIERALAYLRQFGVEALRLSGLERLDDPALDIQRYENERPSAEAACRVGDGRVLANCAYQLKRPGPSDAAMRLIDVDHRGKY